MCDQTKPDTYILKDSGEQKNFEKCILNNEVVEEGTSSNEETTNNWQSLITNKIQVNMDDICPEVFQIIIAKFLSSNHWRKLVPLRLVSKYWRSNIDSYLATKHKFEYSGCLSKGNPPPIMNYYKFNGMLSFYPNMKHLIVKNYTLSDHFVAIIRQHLSNLEKFSLDGCRNISWKGFTILGVRYSHLTFINISNCDLDENRLSILVENLQSLKTFYALNPGREVSFQCLDKISPHIEDVWIGLNHMTNFNPPLKALISGNGKNLSHLGLVVNYYQTTEWSLITNNLKQLKSLKLNFGSVKSQSLKELAKLTNLESLVLAEDSRNNKESILTDEAVTTILKGCSKLKSLALAGAKEETCRFTNLTINQIPYLCPNIEQIRLLNANNLDNDCLSQLGTIDSLFVLHLSSINAISDKGVIDFAKRSRRVRNVRISNCPNITEEIISVWTKAATNRPKDKIKLTLEGINITRKLDDIPTNLNIEILKKSEQ